MTDINVVAQTQIISVEPWTQSIVVDPVTQLAVVLGPAASAISVVNAGPVGPAGAGQGYNHYQASPADTWVINHNLGYKPNVQMFTVGGLEVLGEVLHNSNNQITVSFNTPLSGSARLS